MDKKAIDKRLRKMEPLRDLKAIPPGVAGGQDAEVRSPEIDRSSRDRVPLDDVKAFEEAGWKLRSVYPASAKKKDGAPTEFEVVVDTDGRLKVLSDSMNVKFSRNMSEDVLQSILREYDLSVRRSLEFSPNTYTLDSKSGESLAKAKSLNARQDVEYAEPILIEIMKSR